MNSHDDFVKKITNARILNMSLLKMNRFLSMNNFVVQYEVDGMRSWINKDLKLSALIPINSLDDDIDNDFFAGVDLLLRSYAEVSGKLLENILDEIDEVGTYRVEDIEAMIVFDLQPSDLVIKYGYTDLDHGLGTNGISCVTICHVASIQVGRKFKVYYDIGSRTDHHGVYTRGHKVKNRRIGEALFPALVKLGFKFTGE